MADDVRGEIFIQLLQSFPFALKYKSHIYALLDFHLGTHSFKRHFMKTVLESVHRHYSQAQWIEAKIMFKAVFVYIVLHRKKLNSVDDDASFSKQYPEFTDVNDASEQAALIKFRNTLLVTSSLYNPHGAKTDIFTLVAQMCGGIYLPDSGQTVEAERRVLIFERETGTQFRKRALIHAKSFSFQPQQPRSPSPTKDHHPPRLFSSPSPSQATPPRLVAHRVTPTEPVVFRVTWPVHLMRNVPQTEPTSYITPTVVQTCTPPPPVVHTVTPPAPVVHRIDSAEDTDASAEREKVLHHREYLRLVQTQVALQFWTQRLELMERGTDIPCMHLPPEQAHTYYAYPSHDWGVVPTSMCWTCAIAPPARAPLSHPLPYPLSPSTLTRESSASLLPLNRLMRSAAPPHAATDWVYPMTSVLHPSHNHINGDNRSNIHTTYIPERSAHSQHSTSNHYHAYA